MGRNKENAWEDASGKRLPGIGTERNFMKKRIGTHNYDTEKGTLIGSFDNGAAEPSDVYVASLYVNRSGNYFLHEAGGSNSIVAKVWANGYREAGENIRELSVSEAADWAGLFLDRSEFDREFGEAEDDPVELHIILPRSVFKAIKRRAADEGSTMAEVIAKSFVAYENSATA